MNMITNKDEYTAVVEPAMARMGELIERSKGTKNMPDEDRNEFKELGRVVLDASESYLTNHTDLRTEMIEALRVRGEELRESLEALP